ncbi:MAG: type II toxin-antitoxin system PemK/MazF family toxin [Bacteroides sp.]|nr:type II toxin-antitoxin system PemK/MazF family toxin [Bacteroides sp.]MCM1550250.1 type II toxin-antitoxin system PemK/MazF family toxin [Clostridium sp.]
MANKSYGKYKRGDVVYADFGHKPHGVEGGIRPCVIVSCDASNHDGAPMVTVCPLSSKLKPIPVHVQIKPNDVRGYRLKTISDFLPEDIQTVAKGAIRGKTGYIPVEADVMKQIDRALIRQLNLMHAARNMVMEELQNGSENKED